MKSLQLGGHLKGNWTNNLNPLLPTTRPSRQYPVITVQSPDSDSDSDSDSNAGSSSATKSLENSRGRHLDAGKAFTEEELSQIHEWQRFTANMRPARSKEEIKKEVRQAFKRLLVGNYSAIHMPIDPNGHPMFKKPCEYFDPISGERISAVRADDDSAVPSLILKKHGVEIGRRIHFIPGRFFDKDGHPIHSLKNESGEPIRTLTLFDRDGNHVARRNLMVNKHVAKSIKWSTKIFGGIMAVLALPVGIAFMHAGWYGVEEFIGQDYDDSLEYFVKACFETVNGLQAALYNFSVFSNLIFFPRFMSQFFTESRKDLLLLLPFVILSFFAATYSIFGVVFNRLEDEEIPVTVIVALSMACMQAAGISFINIFYSTKKSRFIMQLARDFTISSENRARTDMLQLYELSEEYAKGEHWKIFLKELKALTPEQLVILLGSLSKKKNYKYKLKSQSFNRTIIYTLVGALGALLCVAGSITAPAVTYNDDTLPVGLSEIVTFAVATISAVFFAKLGYEVFNELCFLHQRFSWFQRQPTVLQIIRSLFLLICFVLVSFSWFPSVSLGIIEGGLPEEYAFFMVTLALFIVSLRSTIGFFEGIISALQSCSRITRLPKDELPKPFEKLQSKIQRMVVKGHFLQIERAFDIVIKENKAMTQALEEDRAPSRCTRLGRNLCAFFKREEAPIEPIGPNEESPLINSHVPPDEDNLFNCPRLSCTLQ